MMKSTLRQSWGKLGYTYTLMLKETYTHISHSVIYFVLSLPWQTNLDSVLKNDPVLHFPENMSSCIRTVWLMSRRAAHFIQLVREHLHNCWCNVCHGLYCGATVACFIQQLHLLTKMYFCNFNQKYVEIIIVFCVECKWNCDCLCL